jgi:phospholipid-binding lipoprotein MlaA
MLAGCATPPPASEPDALAEYRQNNDPLEPTNRVFYRINNALDSAILAPLARGYRAVVPSPVRTGIHNVLTNMSTPVTLANNILEAKPRRAGDSFMRIFINTTVGVGGIFDVAKDWGWPANDSDAGVTLALWGVPGGPFLFLPVLGPSNPRDAVGFGADIGLDPFTYPSGGAWTVFSWSRYGVSAVDARERRLDDIDQIKRTALDPYATFRSLYQQFRSRQIEETRKDKPRTVPAWFPNTQQGSR